LQLELVYQRLKPSKGPQNISFMQDSLSNVCSRDV